MSKTRACSKCHTELPLTIEYFGREKRQAEGLNLQCKKCVSIQRKLFREANRERISEEKKKYREANKERIATQKKKYGKENKAKIAERRKKYREQNALAISERRKNLYQLNRDTVIERVNRYRELNKDIIAERKHKYYEQNRDSINTKNRKYYEQNKEHLFEMYKRYRESHISERRITEQRRQARKRKLPFTLTPLQWDICRKHFDNKCAYCGKEKQLSQDHFLALSKGGEYSKDNIIPSCKSCNSSKNDSSFFVWYPRQKFYSKEREQKVLKYLGYKKHIQQLSVF